MSITIHSKYKYLDSTVQRAEDRWQKFTPVLHCASLLRTIFGSLARGNERARAQNARDSPQTKLDSEINARFLLNEHGDLHFLFYKFNENNVLNN